MRLLVLSDTHGNYPLAIKALEMAGPVDLIVHCGDGIEDARLMEEITGHRIVKVPGNCDLHAPEPPEFASVIAGHKFLITHGDAYNVKGGVSLLHKKARVEDARIVLYGHTHVGSIAEHEGILLVNPGCLRYKWPETSCAILSLDAGMPRVQIIQVNQ